jgi:Uma2 family endonuclease
MVVSTTKMTARQYFMLGEDPPGVKLELVNGEVAVSPSPTADHSNVVLVLSWFLMGHIRANKLGELHHDLDTYLDQFNVRRPDLLFFANEHRDRIGKRNTDGVPDLAIEVLSPGSIDTDRDDKFEQYCNAKIKYYWIVDPALRTFEGWELKRAKYVSIGRAQGVASIRLAPFPDLEIPLKELWRK